MLEKTLSPTRRTLIFTHGALAKTAGEQFAEKLLSRQGPQAAVMTVASADELNEDVQHLAEMVTEALTSISPPNLAVILAETGWKLVNPAEVCLILMMDVIPDGQDKATYFLQTITSVIYQYLGVEPTSLLIWLVGNDGEASVSDCTSKSIAVTRGVVLLGMRNEDGFRLADEMELSQIGAEFLWCLTATPLHDIPEQVSVRSEHRYAEGQLFFTVGLFGWEWNPRVTSSIFTQRWLESIFAHWLSTAVNAHELSTVAVWMQENLLTANVFAQYALHERDRHPPDFVCNSGQFPWPWEVRTLFTTLRFTETVDENGLDIYREQAGFHLTDPLQAATVAIQEYVRSMLDENPISATDQSKAWLQVLLTVCDQQIEQTLDQEDALSETEALLAERSGIVKASLKAWLKVWPADTWRAWLKVCIRPWHWPQLVWHFGKIWQGEQQLSTILTQQAILKRQRIQIETARQGVIELSKIIQHIESQVDEVEQMLASLSREVSIHRSRDNAVGNGVTQLPLVNLPVPDSLYTQLVPDEAGEARLAAERLGGLGQLVTKLDDTLLEPLRRIAEERLTSVYDQSVVNILNALVDSAGEQRKQGQFAWDTACPMWRIDEACLDEITRSQPDQFTSVCGLDAQHLLDWLPHTDRDVIPLAANGKERLWLIRVRLGLASSVLSTGN